MNYENFARPESQLAFNHPVFDEQDMRGYDIELVGHEEVDEAFAKAAAWDELPEYGPGEYDPRDDEGDGYGAGWIDDDGRWDEH
jgi:hypothetical protein